jgi:large subunit ribosomal protein L7e
MEKKRNDIENRAFEFLSLNHKISKKNSQIKNTRKIMAQNYIKEFKIRKEMGIRENRISRDMKKFFVPIKPTIIFAIRLKGINGIPPRSKKILDLIRLKKINNGVFLKLNSSSLQLLKKIEPYVAYGYPTPKTIRTLINKRGFGKIGKRGKWQKVSLVGNKVIDQSLFQVGIHSLNDLVNEIITGGPYFKEVNNFLWPFQLKSPKKGYSKHGKNKNIAESGAYGNWDESINGLINKMI